MISRRGKGASRPFGESGPHLVLETVLERLRRSNPGGSGIDARAVQKALGLRSQYLAQRLLTALRGSSGSFATPEEFVAQAQRVMDASVDGKLGFLFRLHDEDGDGWIHRDELDRLLHIAVAEHDLKLSEREVDEMVSGVLSAGDQDKDGRISLIEFIQLMTGNPQIQQQLADYGVSLLMPGQRARRRMRLSLGNSWQGWVRNDAVLSTWIAAWAIINALLFAEAWLRYHAAGANLYVLVARGCGACLNFNGALIAVPMLRHTITWVRRSALSRVVPVDDAVSLHALIGEAMMAFGVVHSIAHVLNQWPLVRAGAAYAPANVTGVVLLLALLVMWVFSRRFVRRSGRFELFHLTHLAYLAVVVLLFAHGPRFWMWGTLPWLWYLGERLQRALRRRSRARITRVRTLASGVTHVDFERPQGFRYQPGDYVFACVPALAKHEWHPFTLTSAPEDPSTLSVHIRSVGNWTTAVRDHLPESFSAGEASFVRVDGPYGTPSRHILDVPHVVAVAGGIGVTPFASILQSLLLRHEDSDSPAPVLRKLRFVWLNRDQYSFEWFRDLLVELERRDHLRLLDIHTFMTAGRADMAGGVFELARVLRRRRSGDLVTGLQAPTSLGAPDFDRLLEAFCRSPDLPRPEVFFCGPVALGRVVEDSCRRLGLRMRSERF